MDLARKFVLFAGVGVIGTGAHYTVLVLLVQALGVDPVAASSLGFLTGALVNYLLNYRYTFRSRKPHREALAKFLAVAAVGFLINGTLMALGNQAFHLHYLLNQVLATGVVLLWGFTANHLWTFRGERHETS